MLSAPVYTKSFEAEVLERLSRIEVHSELAAGHVADHETRVRGIEKRQWLLAGAAAIVSPLLTQLGLHHLLK